MSTTKVRKNESDEQHPRAKDIEQLEALAFHFSQLSKRLSHDREHWLEAGRDLSKAVEDLNLTLQKLTELETNIKEQVTKVISQESRHAAETISKVMGEKAEQVLTKQIKGAADYLGTVVSKASDTLTDYKWQVSSLKKWFLIGIILSSLIGNVLAGITVYYLLLN